MKPKFFQVVLVVLGFALIAGAVSLFAIWKYNESSASEKAKEIVSDIRKTIPESHAEIPDDRVNTVMPEIELSHGSFSGIIELPAYETELPIYGIWDKSKVKDYPCVFYGSIYDGSLIIGGSNNSGQFDFTDKITKADEVYITDMTGATYAYSVTDIEHMDDASSENLMNGNYDLTLFSKNTYSLDYTVIRCNFK